MSTMRHKRRKRALMGPGRPVKIRYLSDAKDKELAEFKGVHTGTVYKFGERINLSEVDSRDLEVLLLLRDADGHALFEIHVPLKEKIEAEAEAQARRDEAWKAAEALALPPEEPEAKSRARRRKTKPKDSLTDDDKEITISAMDAGIP